MPEERKKTIGEILSEKNKMYQERIRELEEQIDYILNQSIDDKTKEIVYNDVKKDFRYETLKRIRAYHLKYRQNNNVSIVTKREVGCVLEDIINIVKEETNE